MKKKEVSEEEEFSNEDPEEAEEEEDEEEEEINSGDDWTPAQETGGVKRKSRRVVVKKRHSGDDDEDEDEENEEDEDESDSDTGRVNKKKRQFKKDEEEEDDDDFDSDENCINTAGIPPKDFTSGAFVVAKADVNGDKDPILWRIDGKALLQKYLPYKEDGKTLYKSTSTYSGWAVNHKDKYLAAKVTFRVQTKQETIVELHLDADQLQQKETAVNEEKEE